MKRILIAALTLAAGAAMAQGVVIRRGENVLRLSDAPCAYAEVLAILAPEWRTKFRKAHSIINGHDQVACWIATPKGTVHVVWEDGDEGEFPISEFKKDEGI